jgi:protein-S-isoprenylcysteine O-methyltransferase Ste14
MKNILKQLFSLILPVIVLILVPLEIEKKISISSISAFLVGIVFISTGIYIMSRTISGFIRIGKGTLAPWSPTKKLIIAGMYRFVRNPMIIGVIIVLIGESIAILSFDILIWAAIFFIINNIYFQIYEEPDLLKKFGDEYWEYKKNVPRWIPRLTPYNPLLSIQQKNTSDC